jgi:hypothetical protein
VKISAVLVQDFGITLPASAQEIFDVELPANIDS